MGRPTVRADRSMTIEQTFGISEAELFATLSTYVQAQFEGAK